jgi:hypothetical protein
MSIVIGSFFETIVVVSPLTLVVVVGAALGTLLTFGVAVVVGFTTGVVDAVEALLLL